MILLTINVVAYTTIVCMILVMILPTMSSLRSTDSRGSYLNYHTYRLESIITQDHCAKTYVLEDWAAKNSLSSSTVLSYEENQLYEQSDLRFKSHSHWRCGSWYYLPSEHVNTYIFTNSRKKKTHLRMCCHIVCVLMQHLRAPPNGWVVVYTHEGW
jgi:hypothetical protein